MTLCVITAFLPSGSSEWNWHIMHLHQSGIGTCILDPHEGGLIVQIICDTMDELKNASRFILEFIVLNSDGINYSISCRINTLPLLQSAQL